jgi:hypothetical protein
VGIQNIFFWKKGSAVSRSSTDISLNELVRVEKVEKLRKGRLEKSNLEPDDEASKVTERFLLCKSNARRAFILTVFSNI